MEMFIIVFVIIIIIGVGMYFFFKISVASTKETAEDLCVQTATSQLDYVSILPELICSERTYTESYCIDVFKAMAYKDLDDKEALAAGNCPKKVVIEQAYPEPRSEDKECTSVSRAMERNCNYILLYEPPQDVTEARMEAIISAPIALYYPHTDEYRIGRLVISSYM